MAQFPEIQKSIQNYLYEEEGNITRNKLLMVGSLAVLMSVLFALDASAGHSSHRSHSSHSSHSSGSHSSGHSSHTSHQSHTSSTTHSSHASSTHSSHGSSATHSNVSTSTPAPAPAPTPVYPDVLTPQQTYNTPDLPLVPQPAVSAPPASSVAGANGIAAAIAMDETTGKMG